MSKPLISVAIITYNQEEYIGKAIRSVLEQVGDFELEIIIGDDGSTDQTTEICEEFASKHPGFITHLKHGINLGYIRNLTTVIARSRGEFVALLEGDDYWTSPTKLQQQLSIFQAYPDVALCFTNCHIDDLRRKDKKQYFYRDRDISYSLEDCFQKIIVPTSTFLFRREQFPIPEWFCRLPTYEYYLVYLLAGRGDIYYLNELTACRTQHYRGQSSSTVKVNGDKELYFESIYKYEIIQGFSPLKRRRVQNIVLKFQINTASYFISQEKTFLARDLLKQIYISKVALDKRTATVLFSYARLLLKYYLSKSPLHTARQAVG